MKTFKHKTIAAFTFVLFLGLQVYAAGIVEFTKEYHRSFTDVNRNVLLSVSNKFGMVKIVTGETDQITIDVVVSLEAKNQEKAEKLFKAIDISITGNTQQIKAVTHLDKGCKFKELSIDYTIHMPNTGNLDINNKFGNFFLNEINGSTRILVSYGSVDIGDLNNQKNDLTIKFGSGKVKYAHYLNYTSRYSSAKVGRAKLLNMDSQFGKVTVGEVGRMDLKNQYGDSELGTIVELTSDIQFGDMEIEGVLSILHIDIKYGDADVDFISRDFTEVDIDAQFGDIDLGFQSGSNFELMGKVSFGDIDLPKGTIATVDKSGNSDTYAGKLFEGTSPSVVTAKISYGDLDISIH